MKYIILIILVLSSGIGNTINNNKVTQEHRNYNNKDSINPEWLWFPYLIDTVKANTIIKPVLVINHHLKNKNYNV